MENGHLSEDDFEIILASKASHGEGQREQGLLAHCQTCQQCAALLHDYEDANREIASLKDLRSTDQISCPGMDLWLRLAVGVLDHKPAMQLVSHANECRRCSEQLTRAQRYVAGEPEEVTGIESATPQWQRAIARQMAATPIVGKGKKIFSFPRFLAPALAAALVIGIVGAWFLRATRSGNVEELLAQAYSQNRTLEPRFSGAQYGPMRSERGGNNQSMLNQSPALLEALPLISRRLEKEPDNPLWLDAKGRAELLGSNYEAAIQSFQKALDVDPNSPALLTDAASAYFERAQIADRPEDYGRAIELLSKALAKNPDDPIALYNRALINEKMFLFHQALEDWTHYLRLAPTGKWAEEAAQHLNAVRQKLLEQQKRAAEPLLDPGALVQRAYNRDEQVMKMVGRRSEEYLDQAVRKWLPAAFPPAGRSGDTGRFRTVRSTTWQAGPSNPESSSRTQAGSPSERLALLLLADVLKKEHGDEWLADLMKAPPSIATTRAIDALAKAADANASGDFDLARSEATESIRFFRQSANVAGESRASFEMIYALDRAQLGKRCLDAALPLAARLPVHQYSWIQVQLGVEQANCWAQIGQFSNAARHLNQALGRAEKAAYGTLYLRSLGIAASLLTSEGNSAAAAAIDVRGLAHYWGGSFPPMRAHQFYSDMGFPAHETGRWGFALAVEKEAASTIALTEQRLGEAVGRQRLAGTASMAGNYDLAAAEFSRAKDLFASLPPSAAKQTWQASEEIELAKMEIDRRETDKSLLHLSQARKQLPQIVNYFIALHFYRTLGELQHLRGNEKEAERALRSAVAASEWGLVSSRNERERITWAKEASPAYRGLAEIYWQSGNVEDALQLWEWYRGAAVRQDDGSRHSREAAVTRLKSSDIDFASLESAPLLPRMNELLKDLSSFRQNTVLSYMQLPAGLAVWAFDDRGIAAKWIALAPRELSRLSRRFRDECASPNSDLTALRKDARRLYDLLIGPVADHLSPQRALMIELDDSMAEIPMSALLDPAGAYLGETYSLVFSPGLLYQNHLRKVQDFSVTWPALVIGSPALAGNLANGLEPIDDANSEAQYVASQFEKAVMLIGAQASLDNVERALSGTAVFHFAGHALGNSQELGLMLAGPPGSSDNRTSSTAVLNVSSLPASSLQGLRLVVLSACSTAVGDSDERTDPETLVKIFLRAGVPQVVASRWNVHSATTAKFMRVFYDHLLEHGSVPGSLRAAGLQLRQDPDSAHPYYWAAFSAFGR